MHYVSSNYSISNDMFDTISVASDESSEGCEVAGIHNAARMNVCLTFLSVLVRIFHSGLKCWTGQ